MKEAVLWRKSYLVTQSGSGIHETTMPDPGEKKTFIVTFDYADGTEVVTQTVQTAVDRG